MINNVRGEFFTLIGCKRALLNAISKGVFRIVFFIQKVLLIPKAFLFIAGAILYVIITTFVVFFGFPLILFLFLMEKIERRILKPGSDVEKNSKALIHALKCRLGIGKEENATTTEDIIEMGNIGEKLFSCPICFTPFDGKNHRQCALIACG